MIYQTLKSLVVSLILLTGITSISYADFYVIPVLKNMKNVVTVAKSGGKYTDIKTALSSITDASETNPYLIFIGPGEYTVTDSAIQMKSWVTIMGSGEKATVLKGSISSGDMDATSAIISGENNATLGNVNIVNEGGSNESIAIYNNNASPLLHNVTATASGGSISNYCVFNTDSSPTMTNVTATGSGGSAAVGVYNFGSSSPSIRNSILSGTNGGIIFGKAISSIVIGGGTACSYCVDENGDELDENCNPPLP